MAPAKGDRAGGSPLSPGMRDGFLASQRPLRRRIRLAWMAIAVERVVRAFWPLAAGATLAMAITLSGLLPILPGWIHAGVLALAGAGLAGLLIRGIRGYRLPDWGEAVRRLDSGVPLRPATTLADRPAIGLGDPVSEKLWELHLLRVARAAASLRPPEPDLRLSRQDPWVLRYSAPLLLFAAGILSWGSWGDRIEDAVQPRWEPVAQVETNLLNLEAWAEPPAYTGEAPVYLSGLDAGAGMIELPEGTRLQAWVHDAPLAPTLEVFTAGAGVDAQSGAWRQRAGFEKAETDSYRLVDWEIPGGRLRVEAEGEVLAEWGFRILPDVAPSIEFRAPPQATRTGAVTFSYGIVDDYGVALGRAEIRLAGDAEGEGLVEREPIEIPLALPPAGRIRSPEGGEEFVIRDLLSHPWAGAQVEVSLFVEDDVGQVGASGPVPFRLPEHAFEDPMARAFAEQRRGLSLSNDLGDIDLARTVIEAAIRHPSDYFDDPVPFLAARVSAARLDAMLARGISESGLSEVSALLWRAARRLDEGVLPDALEALRERLRAVEDALRQGAEPGVLERLLAELREAIGAYLSALAESLRDTENGEMSFDPRQQQIASDALDDVLRSIGDAASIGSEEMARRELAQLRSLLENLQAGPSGAMSQGLTEIGEIIRSQTALADETMRRDRGASPGADGGEPRQQGMSDGGGEQQGEPGFDGQELASEQDALRSRLEALREGVAGQEGDAGEDTALGRFSSRLEDAADAMGRAVGALGEGDAPGALEAQREALESLQGAAMELFGQGEGVAVGVLPGDAGSGQGGTIPGLPGFANPFGDVGLPDRQALHRARELFDEIRRKSAERSRPAAERDYYRRLIDRF